jgi:hypothetical protein
MNPPPRHPGDYSVLQFSLTKNGGGRTTQNMKALGTFSSVESAFALARRTAEQEVARLQETPGEPGAVRLVDTEWGYDVRRGWLTATRLWVHDAGATRPLAAGG